MPVAVIKFGSLMGVIFYCVTISSDFFFCILQVICLGKCSKYPGAPEPVDRMSLCAEVLVAPHSPQILSETELLFSEDTLFYLLTSCRVAYDFVINSFIDSAQVLKILILINVKK